jgi:hypothetical protein
MKSLNKLKRNIARLELGGCVVLIVIGVWLVIGMLGAWLWPYSINTWLDYLGKPQENHLKVIQGFCIGLIPIFGAISIPLSLITFILMLFIK